MLINKMLSFQTISRSITPYSGVVRYQLHTSIKMFSSSSSSDSSDSDSDSDKKTKKAKPKASVDKLKLLNSREGLQTLKKLMSQMNEPTSAVPRIDVAIPKRSSRPVQKPEAEPTEESQFETKFASAARNVAKEIGGDVEKIELDLLDRLLKPKFKRDDTKSESQSSSNQRNLLDGINISGHYANKQNERVEHTRQVSQRVDNSEIKFKAPRSIIRDLLEEKFSGKSVAPKSRPTQPLPPNSRVSQYQEKRHKINQETIQPLPSIIKSLLVKQRRSTIGSTNTKYLYHNKYYDIFPKEPTGEPQVSDLSIWTELEKKEYNTILYHPPQNYFQEMIQWTEQGKIWQFPIDNEQGMKEEENVHFSDHVFLERHLKGWCPKQGPIRHFMELVCVGLSKNAFMTVQEKIDHIMWYKDYFGDKREILLELGAIDSEDPALLPKPTNKIDLGPHV